MDIDMSNANMGDLGSMIKDKVADSIKNVDVLSLLQKMVASSPEEEESEEIREKLQGVLQQYNDMPETEKVEFVTQLKDILAAKLALKLQDMPVDFSGVESALKETIYGQLYIVGAAIFVFIIIFVFFGYKLYRSIKDKEKKKEEKKKMKQMKKKK